jgi:hypothetical protein
MEFVDWLERRKEQEEENLPAPNQLRDSGYSR